MYSEWEHCYLNRQAHIFVFTFKGKRIHVIFNSKLWFVHYNCSQTLSKLQLEDMGTKDILKQVSRMFLL